MAPHVPTPAPRPPGVELRALGQSAVLVDGQPVRWPARSAEELLWFLHAHPEGVYRHDLLARLWNAEDTPAAANRFRVALHRLRSTLHRPDAVQETAGRYALHPDLLISSDTFALEQAIRAAGKAPAPAEQIARLRAALGASASGEYLPHLQGDWVTAARAAHRAAIVEAELQLSALHCASHACTLAVQTLSRAAQADPLMAESHHQRLMACLAMTRDRYAAVEHYRRYRQFLANEVGDTPMPETVELAERIKRGEKPCLSGQPDFMD